MTYNPTSIANYFITTYANEYALIDSDMVIGLTYFSYGWYLGFSEGKSTLIKEPLLCRQSCAYFGTLWENLIVARTFYHYKKLPNPQGNQKIAKEDQHLLDLVWNRYGHIGNLVLKKAFYWGDTPWRKALNSGRLIIPLMEVSQYFKQLIDDAAINEAKNAATNSTTNVA